MFYWTKAVLLTNIVFTFFAALVLDKSVPYFPIEISRTTTGPISSWVFRVGTLLTLLITIKESPNWILLSPFVGLLILAFVSDEYSWSIHMFGVLLMVIPIALHSLRDFNRASIFVLLCGLYAMRLVFKAVVVWHYPNPIKTAMELMFHGRFANEIQRIAFQLGGLLQWVFLFGLLELYTN